MKESLSLVREVEMNLSKYFKNSDSFQPESLVRQTGHEGKTPRRTPVFLTSEHQPDVATAAPPPLSEQSDSGEGMRYLQADDSREPSSDRQGERGAVRKEAEPERAAEQRQDMDSGPADVMEMGVAEEKIAESYRQGLEDGLAKAEEDFGDALRALLSSCRQLETVRETLISNSKEELIEFALVIAERIVRGSVRDQDETIVAAIEEALQRAIKSEEFSIHLHPEDYQTVFSKRGELTAGVSGLKNIVIKQDSQIERGGARIESDNCIIDCTIGCQFDVIREELKKLC